MSRQELVRRVAAVTDSPRWLAYEMVEVALAEIQRASNRGEGVGIRGIQATPPTPRRQRAG